MPTPWSAPIRAARQLSIFPTSKVTGGPWKTVFTKALAEFNALSTKHSLGVTFSLAATAPDPSGVGGADVQFDTINGTVNFTCFNQAFSDNLSGTAMEGHTRSVMQVFGANRTIAKAFIFVPATPQSGKRVVGNPMKLLMAVHEMIHACGLDNADHSSLTNNADVFVSGLQFQAGANPDADRGTPFGMSTPVMPPIVLAQPTITLIQNNW